MKKKAGQASNYVRSADVRRDLPAPVSSNVPSRTRAASAPARTTSAQPVRVSSGSKTSGGNVKSTVKTAKSTTKRVKAKKKSHAGAVVAIILVVLLLAGGGAYGYLYYTGFFKPHAEVVDVNGSTMNLKVEDIYTQLNTNTFYTGTVIDDVDVSGMTVEQAVEAVEQKHNAVTVDVKLKLDDQEYPLDFSNDIVVEYNTKDVVNEAFAKFRPQSDSDVAQLTECYNNVEQLKTTPMKFETSCTVKINGVSEKVHAVLDPLADNFKTTKDAEIGEFDPKTKQFSEARYKSLVAQSKAIKMTYDLLSSLYVMPKTIADCDAVLQAKTNHGMVIDDLLRYFIAMTFVTLDKEGGKEALATFVNETYEALMDIEANADALKNATGDGFGDIWSSLRTSLKAQDAYSLRCLATLSILIVDTGYTDLLKLGNGDGTISTYINQL